MLTIEEFLRLSNRLREYYGKQIKDRFSEYTFSPNEISILILLQNNTSITTSTQLRVVLGVSKALVSRSVTSLEQKGLITMKKVSENRRISYIELTEEAIPVLEKISIEIDKINQVLFKDIPTKDIQCMIDTMNKMNENRKIVLDTLNEQHIEYDMFEHQAVYTVDEIEDSDLWNHENGIGAKNLFLRDGSGKHHFLVIIREDKQADLKKVRDEIGSSRLSFASAERLMKYLNIEPGSVSPLGVLNDQECVIPVFFDEDLKEYEYIAVHPNDNTATIWMKLADLVNVIKLHGNQVKFINVE